MRLLLTMLAAGCYSASVPDVERTPPARAVEAPHEPASTWQRSWDADAERSRLAKLTDVHELEAEYVDACGPGLTYRIIGSPLLRHRTASWNTTEGVVIQLSPHAGTPELLLNDLRCHLIGITMSPFGVDDSPFDLPGMRVDARGDESAVTLKVTVKDPMLVAELQQRLRAQVDEAQRKYHED
jgi:hypothetical protein